MARIRTIKPELFFHEELYLAEQEESLPLRLAFIGLFTQCDREGRFKWRPLRLGAQIFPYDDIDFSRVLNALSTRGFIVKYTTKNNEKSEFFGYIPSWEKHQSINNKERDSEIPNPKLETVVIDALSTRAQRHLEVNEGKGKERKGKERKGKERKGKEREIARVEDATEANASSLTPGQQAREFFSSLEAQEQWGSKITEKLKIPPELCKNEMQKFVLYWTEKTKSGKKERWETEKTFEVGRRVAKWFTNSREFNKVNSEKSSSFDFSGQR